MSTITKLASLLPARNEIFTPARIRKAILVAISTIFAIGMVVTYAIGAPWLLPFVFFSLALAPLYPLSKTVDNQRERISG